jgi:hypothetical protein
MSLTKNFRLINDRKYNAEEVETVVKSNAESIINQRETAALLELLALGRKEFKEGKFSDAEVFLNEMND